MGNLFAERLELCVSDRIEKQGLENMNTHELGEAVDMIKDSYEMEKLKSEKRYYDTLVDAMERHEYSVDYDEGGMIGYPRNTRRMGYPGQPRTSTGRFAYDSDRMMRDADHSMRNYGSKYGYSHDEYMENREHATPEQKKEMLNKYMDEMYEMAKDMVEDMSPEEKQIWKSKLSRVINM